MKKVVIKNNKIKLKAENIIEIVEDAADSTISEKEYKLRKSLIQDITNVLKANKVPAIDNVLMRLIFMDSKDLKKLAQDLYIKTK